MLKYVVMYGMDTFFECNAECYVNWTSCVACFEKSGCTRFFQRYPKYTEWYFDKYSRSEVKIGNCYMYSTGLKQPIYIASLAYKRNWHTTVHIRHLIKCIEELKKNIEICGIRSVALPAIGVKMHERKWKIIKETYESMDREDLDVFIYSKTRNI